MENAYSSRLRGIYSGSTILRRGNKEVSMAKHDESRRAFLVCAAVGAGAAAGAGLVPEAYAQKSETRREADAATSAPLHSAGDGHGAFFNHDDAMTIEAFAE